MFEAFVITLIIVGWAVILAFLLWYSYDNKIALVGVVFWCTIAVFFAVYMGMEESKRVTHAPCIEWQTQMMCNAATKMMQPVKFCVQRGEWEE